MPTLLIGGELTLSDLDFVRRMLKDRLKDFEVVILPFSLELVGVKQDERLRNYIVEIVEEELRKAGQDAPVA